MPPDPRTPVLVGVGQSSSRPRSPEELTSALALMVDAARAAAHDAGGTRDALAAVASVRTVDSLSWHAPNTAAAVATALGLDPVETVTTTPGGNSPQLLVARTADDIAAGRLDAALIAGAEALYSRHFARRAGGRAPEPTSSPLPAPDRVLGDPRPGTTDDEQARGLLLPVQIYPLFENAIRAASGASIDGHRERIAALWSRFSSVAATNPFAWSPEARTALEIATPSPDNRLVGFPYTKRMNANIQVDQGAALLMCSAERATALGVPRDRWIFPWTAADAHDHWFVSDRWDLHRSPAIAACGRAALGHIGAGVDDIALIDLYSCFPSAVELGAAALGLDLETRELTVTGGLTFAGGPGNNYVSHSIATMVERLRSRPGELGLVTALGWYATKHSVAVYGTEPPPSQWASHDVQRDVDALGSRGMDAAYQGPFEVETYTVMHERDGTPSLGIAGGLTPAGRRAWASSREPDVVAGLLESDPLGRRAAVGAAGELIGE